MRNMWKAPSTKPEIEHILSNFSFPFSPIFIDRMFCVKDEKELKKGQSQVLNSFS